VQDASYLNLQFAARWFSGNVCFTLHSEHVLPLTKYPALN